MNGVKRPGRHSRPDAAASTGPLLEAVDRLALVFVRVRRGFSGKAAASTGPLLEAAAPRPGPLALVARWVRRAFSGWVAGTAVLAGFATGWLDSRHLTPPLGGMVHHVMVAAWLYVLLWLLVFFIRHIPDMLGDMLSEMLAPLILGLLIIALPLLAIPAFRRWVSRQFRDNKRRSPTPGA